MDFFPCWKVKGPRFPVDVLPDSVSPLHAEIPVLQYTLKPWPLDLIFNLLRTRRSKRIFEVAGLVKN